MDRGGRKIAALERRRGDGGGNRQKGTLRLASARKIAAARIKK